MEALLEKVTQETHAFLQQHAIGKTAEHYHTLPLSGAFSLRRGKTEPDLYGLIDASYSLHILGALSEKTNRTSRKIWAEQILACQDEQGWFSKKNLRGHSPEHATAYAIATLKLLEVEPDEAYFCQIRPIVALKPILTDHKAFLLWLKYLDFRPTAKHILEKKLGWHYIWRGSHVGGGIAAIIGMVDDLFEQWWPQEIDVHRWFQGYFDWLGQQANVKTGYWQRAFWNLVYRQPTLIDMGGAVHFLWIYALRNHPFPYPEATLRSTLTLQRTNGLYKDHPFCIDLDGNFCIIRSFLQMSDEQQRVYQEQVHLAIENNFEGVLNALTLQPFEQMYTDSHGLPGALAALVECAKLPDFKYAHLLEGWQNPFDKVWWL